MTEIFSSGGKLVRAINMGADVFIHDTYLHVSPWGWVVAAVSIFVVASLFSAWIWKRKSR